MLKLSLSTRTPLALQQHKPIPIATYIPKFDEGYNPNRRFDPDTERAEQSKIKALYKKEKKGAIRELRKDNRFLAAEEVKRKAEDDAVYNKKVSFGARLSSVGSSNNGSPTLSLVQQIAKIMGSLEDERAEEKQHERAKVRFEAFRCRRAPRTDPPQHNRRRARSRTRLGRLASSASFIC